MRRSFYARTNGDKFLDELKEMLRILGLAVIDQLIAGAALTLQTIGQTLGLIP